MSGWVRASELVGELLTEWVGQGNGVGGSGQVSKWVRASDWMGQGK